MFCTTSFRCRPYYHENTGSRLISEVKRGKARLVLGSVTAWEPLWVLTAFLFSFFIYLSPRILLVFQRYSTIFNYFRTINAFLGLGWEKRLALHSTAPSSIEILHARKEKTKLLAKKTQTNGPEQLTVFINSTPLLLPRS